MSRTISESLYDGYAQQFDATAIVAEEKTAFQDLLIFDSKMHGRVLVLDGIIQLTELDEFTYSEMLAHPPIFALGGIEHAMIVGGGDGAVAEEILKHSSVKTVELLDIDGRVVELSKEHLGGVHNGVFDDPRLAVHAVDAFEFLEAEASQGHFDLIIADRPDPVGPAEVLFSQTFYDRVRNALSDQGVAVFQTGVPIYQPEEFTDAIALLSKAFPMVGSYLTVTPTYIGGQMALTWASKGTDLPVAATPEELAERFETARIETRYYNPATHQAAFALPAFIEDLLPTVGD